MTELTTMAKHVNQMTGTSAKSVAQKRMPDQETPRNAIKKKARPLPIYVKINDAATP